MPAVNGRKPTGLFAGGCALRPEHPVAYIPPLQARPLQDRLHLPSQSPLVEEIVMSLPGGVPWTASSYPAPPRASHLPHPPHPLASMLIQPANA